MNSNSRIRIIVLLFLVGLLVSGPVLAEDRLFGGPLTDFPLNSAESGIPESFYRTELYFGRSRPGGGMVTDEEWEKFLSEIVTPRFPNGFTILKGTGQYRERSGRIISETSEVLVFLYPQRVRTASRRKIEAIRSAYKKQFNQESVLRMDLVQSISVFY